MDSDRACLGGQGTCPQDDAWSALSARNQGTIILKDHLLAFRSHDIRTQHYRSQAGMILGEAETQPWRLGILMPRPSLWGLLKQNPVLLPDTNREQALQVAERLREAVATTPAKVDRDVTEDGALAYTTSLGVTLVSAGESPLKPAIKRVDQGLYAAKEAGRNRAHWQPVSL